MQTEDIQSIAVVPFQTAEITLHTGHEVFKLLSEEGFLQGWDALYQACPWATAFQSRSFVATWYQVYQNKYLPIVVKRVENGQLTGLLTMAKYIANAENSVTESKRGRIVGAGHFEAEYQTWLSEAFNSDAFIKTALIQLRIKFPFHDILFRYIPPQAPLGWIKTNVQWKHRCVMQSFSRPLMEMSDPGITKLFRKMEYRNKLNRLKRLGELRFERITDPTQFAAILKELIVHYDFRQGALFNKNNFRDEPLKEDLLLALFEKDLLHVTVLKVNETILASIVAINGGEWVHLGGINIHTPFNAKFYSPGFVHFIMLGQRLLNEGIAMFDLTPGGDFYKERMATKHDQVIELVITDSFIYRVKRQLRTRIHDYLIEAGKWPMGVEVALRKRLYIFKARVKMIKSRSGLRLLSEKLRQPSRPKNLEIYQVNNQPLSAPAPMDVRRDSLADLLEFEAKGTWMTRWEFLENAMRRFEVGEHCYSWCAEGRLLGCVWLGSAKNFSWQGKQNSALTADAAMLQGFYAHPAAQKQLPVFLSAVAAQAAKDQGQEQLYAALQSKEKTLGQVLEDIGFQKAI